MNKIENILLIPNPRRDIGYSLTRRIAEIAEKCKVAVYMPEQNRTDELSCVNYFAENPPKEAELILVVGGDGSVLDCAKHAIEYGIPILGVNCGHLGYLTQLESDGIEALYDIFGGKYEISRRSLLSVKSNTDNCECEYFPAMNDVVLTHFVTGSMITYEISDGGRSSLEYSSDSLVIATSGGSTGYSMSGGGPILDARLDAICVTPIAPHSFFGRSMVFGADREINVVNTSDRNADIAVMADGKSLCTLKAGDSITVTAAEKQVEFIDIGDCGTLDKLCKKMKMSNAKYR